VESYLANAEAYGIYILAAGVLLGAIGSLWLVVSAFRQHLGWGLAVLLLVPLGSLAFLVVHFRRAWLPMFVILIGASWIATAFLAPALHMQWYGLNDWERVVEGEVHLTLTGWNKPNSDYAKLAKRSDVVVLQMANKDVTDDTLAYLKNLTNLRELDLENTQITDEGLKTLKGFESLQDLRLRNTKITDAGFREHLLPLKNLKNLDVRDTDVSSKTMREWKKADSENRKYLR
jgi:hypothetical protein